MDEQLKQRIVGIMVITALAAIFIPMLFDEPISDADSYNHTLPIPGQPDNTLQASIQSIPTSQKSVITPRKIVPRNLTAIPTPISNQQDKMGPWTIKVGSFGVEKNASEFEKRLRKQGFAAYIKLGKNDTGPLFELHVGPELDYTRAKNEQQRLQTLFNTQTQLYSE